MIVYRNYKRHVCRKFRFVFRTVV